MKYYDLTGKAKFSELNDSIIFDPEVLKVVNIFNGLVSGGET